jgi:hypothetical protein
MKRLLRWVVVPSLMASSAIAGGARIAEGAEPTTAEALFREARELIAKGDYAAACPKLEESQRLDPAPGTEFNLARCYELTGRLASAWGAYVEVASITHAAGQAAREHHARERIAAIESRLSYVIVKMRDASSTGVYLTRDGTEMPLAQLEVAIPIDAGEHVLRATAKGKTAWERRFRVDQDAQRITIDVPALEDAPAPTTAAGGGSSDLPGTTLKGATQAGGGETQRTVAVTFLGASVVAAGVGAYFGLTKVSLASRAREQCPGDVCTTVEGAQTVRDSDAAGNRSTGAFVGMGALAIAGGVLWLTAPKRVPVRSVDVAPMVTATSGGLFLNGSWQ